MNIFIMCFLGLITFILVLFLFSACVIASRCSRVESLNYNKKNFDNGGMFINKVQTKKIKIDGQEYYFKFGNYPSGRLKISLCNKNKEIEVTFNLSDIFLSRDKMLINPLFKNKIGILKKNRIIRDVEGFIMYNDEDIPVASFNFGILRKYGKNQFNNCLAIMDSEVKYE